MRETGVVISKHGGWVNVLLTKGEKCEGCSACTAYGPNSMSIQARNEIDAKTGDIVDVEVSPKQVVGLSFLIFLFPVIAMICGYFLGLKIGSNLGLAGEGSGIVGAVSLLILSFLIIKIYDTTWGKSWKNAAYVVSRSQFPKDENTAFESFVQLGGLDEQR